VSIASFFGAYYLNCYQYSFCSDLLLGIFASALLVFAISLISYLFTKKSHIEKYTYELLEIIKLYKKVPHGYTGAAEGGSLDYYALDGICEISRYDLRVLENIVNDYHTFFPWCKSKKIIKEAKKEIDSYKESLPNDHDIARERRNNNFVCVPPNLKELEALVSQLEKPRNKKR